MPRKGNTWNFTQECKKDLNVANSHCAATLALSSMTQQNRSKWHVMNLITVLVHRKEMLSTLLHDNISHAVNGEEWPVAYSPRTLTAAERKYAHIEREALAIMYGTQKFYKYLYGRLFIIVKDHLPLTYIFNPKNHSSSVAAARMHRCSNLVASYQYTIQYRKGDWILNADGLSGYPYIACGRRKLFITSRSFQTCR